MAAVRVTVKILKEAMAAFKFIKMVGISTVAIIREVLISKIIKSKVISFI
jgi:hypothetical protein